MKFDRRIALFILIIFIPAILISRTFLWTNGIDISTGFYLDNTTVIQTVYRTIVAVAIIFVILIVFLGKSFVKKANEEELVNPYKADLQLLSSQASIFFGTLAAIMAFLLFVFSANEIFGNKNISTIKMVEYISMLSSALVFGILAVRQYLGRAINKGLGYSMLIPAIWITIRSALIFKNFIIITSKSQNLLIMLFVLSWLIFIVEFARLYSGFEKKSTRPVLVIMGIMTFIFGIAETLPVYIFMMKYPNTSLPFESNMLLIDFSMSLFAIGAVAQLLGPNIKVKQEPLKEADVKE